MKKFSLGFVAGILFSVLASAVTLRLLFPNYLETNAITFSEIPEHERKAYQELIVSVYSGNKASSGCVLDKQSKTYLTSLHGISNAILDGDEIFVNSEKAKVIGRGRTDESDYAILTTNLNMKAEKVVLPEYEFKVGDNIRVAGNPGSERSLVQPGRIINDFRTKQEEGGFISHKAVYTLYVEKGISGSCVYPENSFTPVAVFTKDDPKDPKRIGRISLLSKTIE